MKKILFLLLNISIVFGQSKIDSIYNSIKDKSEEEKFKHLAAVCWESRYNDSRLALDAGSKALEIARKTKNKSFEARILNIIGVIFKWMNNLSLSMEYSEKALKAAREGNDSLEIGYAENNIGGTYQIMNYNSLALEHIFTALQIFKKINSEQGIAHSSVNLGTIFQQQQNYDKALEHFNRALDLRIKRSDKNGEAFALNAIARILLDQKKPVQAREIFLKIDTLVENLKDKNLHAQINNGLSLAAFAENNFEEALKYEEISLELIKQIGSTQNEITSRTYLSIIQSNLLRFREADFNLGEVERLMRNSKNDLQLLKFYEAKSIYFEKMGDPVKALSYHKLFTDTKDLIIRHENIARGFEMEAVNDYIRTKNENVVLQKSIEFKEQQKTYLIIIIVLSILSVLVIYWRYRVKHALNNQLSEVNAMKDLFFGIIAHDLKNPFLSILGATDLLLKDIDNMEPHEVKSVVKLIDSSGRQTYKLLENLLYWSMSQTGKIRYNPETINLVELVNDTIALHTASAESKNIKLNSNYDGEVVASCDAEMIRLVLRNLVSNGIKYTHEGGEVTIILEKKNNSVTVSVEDNGVGMADDYSQNLSGFGSRLSTPGTRGEKGTGLGLILCRDFIQRNQGEFKIESREGNGSKFVFTLPAFD